MAIQDFKVKNGLQVSGNSLISGSLTVGQASSSVSVIAADTNQDVNLFTTTGNKNISLGSSTSTVVVGNLTVNGTTTTVNATTLDVNDINVTLGNVTSPTNTTANGGGITLKGTTDKTIVWDSANTNWTSSEHWNIASGKSYKINTYNVLSNTTLTLYGSSSGSTTFTVPSSASGSFILTNNATGWTISGGTTAKTLTVNKNLTLDGFDGSTLTIGTGSAKSFTIDGNTGATLSIGSGGTVVYTGSSTTSGLTMTTSRILGRTTASSGAIEEITIGTGLSLTAGQLTATGTIAGLTLTDPSSNPISTTVDGAAIVLQTKNTTSGAGGSVTVATGSGTGANAGGTLAITGGQGGTTGAGGQITITSGAGGPTSGNAGNITIDSGATTSGTKGTINIGNTNSPTINIGNSGSTTTVTGTTKISGLTTNGIVYTTSSNGTLNSAARTLWGQSFTGAANITGTLSNVGNITFSTGASTTISITSDTAARHINIGGQVNTAASGVGGSLVLTGGIANGTTSTGGDVSINAGTGTLTNGIISIGTTTGAVTIGKAGNTLKLIPSSLPGSIAFVKMATDGTISADTTTYLTSSTGVTTFSAGTTGLTPSAATSGAITLAGTLIPANGGTGLSTVTNVGELYYGNTTSAMGRIAPVASGSYLASAGTAAAPVWTAFPTIGNGTLGVSIGVAGATNTTVTWGNSTGFSANTGSNSTYDLRVGPALTALATLMTTAGAGFIKRGATADTYTIDTNTYLTAEADTLTTVTGRGATTTNSITVGSTLTLNHTTNAMTIVGASGATTAYLLDSVSTTVNAFGAASTLTIAPLTTTQTINIGTGVMAASNTKTINIGTNSAASSTTAINIGSFAGTTSTNLNGATINLGSTSQAATVYLNAISATGTAALDTNVTGNGTVNLFSSMTTGSLNIASGLTTGTIYLGASAVGAKNIYIGTSTGVTLINGTIRLGTSSTVGYVWTASDTAGAGAWSALSLPAGQTAGSATSGYLQYAGTTKTSGQLDGGSTAPTNTTRLNYDGYFYATRFYGDGSQLTGVSSLPSQTGNGGKYLTTDGANASWATVDVSSAVTLALLAM